MGEQAVVRCQCGNFNETVQLLDSVPIPGLLCHCNICRHVTGAATFRGVTLSSPPVEAFQKKLVKYGTSETIWRYFCETCGSHVGYHVPKEDRWGVSSGNIDQLLGPSKDKGLLERYTGHKFVGDTIDGGLARCVPDIPVYMDGDDKPAVQDLEQELAKVRPASRQVSHQDKLEAACHCGGVQFSLSRPDPSSAKNKWHSILCVCRSCRLSIGQTVTAWIKDIPFSKIKWSDDDSTYDGQVHGSLCRFRSSAGVTRDFCGTCGASIFFRSEDRGDVLDVVAGVLRAEDGVLARSWLTWLMEPFHSIEDVVDQQSVRILQENMNKLNE